MHNDKNLIFERYQSIVLEAPIYASEGDIDVKNIASKPSRGYAIGDHATKTSKDIFTITQEIVDRVKTEVFTKQASNIKGKTFDLFYPGTPDAFRQAVQDIVGQVLQPRVTRPSDWKFSARVIANDVMKIVHDDGVTSSKGVSVPAVALDTIAVTAQISHEVSNAVSGAEPGSNPAEQSGPAAPVPHIDARPTRATISSPFNISKEYQVASEVTLEDEDLRVAYHRLVRKIGTHSSTFGRNLANCLMGTMSYGSAKRILEQLTAAGALYLPDASAGEDTSIETPTLNSEDNPETLDDAKEAEYKAMLRSQAGGRSLASDLEERSVNVYRRRHLNEGSPASMLNRAGNWMKSQLPTMAPNMAAGAKGQLSQGNAINSQYRQMLTDLGMFPNQLTPDIMSNYVNTTLGIDTKGLSTLKGVTKTTKSQPMKDPAQFFFGMMTDANVRAKTTKPKQPDAASRETPASVAPNPQAATQPAVAAQPAPAQQPQPAPAQQPQSAPTATAPVNSTAVAPISPGAMENAKALYSKLPKQVQSTIDINVLAQAFQASFSSPE